MTVNKGTMSSSESILAYFLCAVVLTAILPSTIGVECYRCSGLACIDPENQPEGDVEIVSCSHGCRTTNWELFSSSATTLGDIMNQSGTPVIGRNCVDPQASRESCSTSCGYEAASMNGALTRQVRRTCSDCCHDNLCNHYNVEDVVDVVGMWCYQCSDKEHYSCDQPFGELREYDYRLSLKKVECDTACTMSVDLTRYQYNEIQRRGCATSMSICDKGCETPDKCTFCCQGSLCNDTPWEDLDVRTNFTHSCYRCEGGLDSDCNHNLTKEVEVAQCYNGCTKTVGADYIIRGCIDPSDLHQNCFGKDEVCKTNVCQYCCIGELCNAAVDVVPRPNVATSVALTALVTILVYVGL